MRLRHMGGAAFTGKYEFSITLRDIIIGNDAKTCRLLTPSQMTVTLPTISSRSLPFAGDEVLAGQANLRLQCDSGVTVWATLTDSTNPGNTSDMLTLTDNSTATGIGLKIYKNEDSSALQFGPDSYVKGTQNQWQLSNGTESSPSVNLKVKYVNTMGTITPGTVNGIVTYTFSYQ